MNGFPHRPVFFFGLRSSWGWTLLSRSGDDSGWLPFSHSDMEAARQATKRLVTHEGIHPFLILNYDQLWRNAFTLRKTPLIFKDRSGTGRRVKKSRMNPRGDKTIHAIRGARRPITVLTSSWSDGRPGPVCFCVPERKLSPQEMHASNAANVGRSYVISSQSHTHFMCAQTLMEQCYSAALEQQRKRYGLDFFQKRNLNQRMRVKNLAIGFNWMPCPPRKRYLRQCF